MTEKTFKLVKKHARHMLRYFQINFDDAGNQFIRVIIPPAFEGLALKQLSELTQNQQRKLI